MSGAAGLHGGDVGLKKGMRVQVERSDAVDSSGPAAEEKGRAEGRKTACSASAFGPMTGSGAIRPANARELLLRPTCSFELDSGRYQQMAPHFHAQKSC